LVNPQYVDSRYAPWLSQFNGHRLKKNIKYLYNGLTDTTYATNQDMFTSTGAVESYVRWQLSNGYYGRAAGTTEAIREAAKQVLHYTKNGNNSTYFVSITAHYQSDPFKILIRTLLNETFDCESNGDESYALLDAVEMAKPMGYKIYHEAVAVVEFRIGDVIPGTKTDGTELPGNPIGNTSDGMYPLGNVVPNDATGTPESGIVIASVTSAAFTMLAGDTSVTITLTGGTFKAGAIVAGDFTFAGTDATALAAGIFTRTGNTVVTITGLSGLVGTDNTVLVKTSTQATQASAVVGAGTT
jgi:hypothetical protein